MTRDTLRRRVRPGEHTAPRQPLTFVREEAVVDQPSAAAAAAPVPPGGSETDMAAWLHEHVGRPVEDLLSAGLARAGQVGDELSQQLGAQLGRWAGLWDGWWQDATPDRGAPDGASVNAMPPLPESIQAAIGRRLADRDRAHLALANRDWHAALSPHLVVPRVQAALQQPVVMERFVATLGVLQAALDRGWAGGLPAAELPRLAGLLVEAVEQTSTLPWRERPLARQLVWQAVRTTPAPWGDAALAALLARIGDLPGALQLAEFRAGHQAIESLEPARRGPALAAWWSHLGLLGDPQQRAHLVERGFEQVAGLPQLQQPRPLAALLGQIGLLPQAVRRQVYHQGFAAVGQLPRSLQSEPLAALYSQLQQVPMTRGELEAEHRRGMEVILALAMEHRGRPMEQLIGQIGTYRF